MAVLPISISVSGISKVDSLKKSVRELETSSNKTAKATNSLSNGLKTLAGAAVAYIAIDRIVTSTIEMGKAFVSTADDMSQLNSRLSLVTSSTSELNSVQKELLATSNSTRVSLQSTGDLYTSLARSTRGLSYSQQELINATQTINQTLAISGTSAQTASASLFQLSQGLSAGALRGEELNSILEGTPRLAQAIADGMGVSIAELRKLGSEGALTAEKVLESLKTQAQTVDAEFKGIKVTAQGGYQVLQNTIDSTIGKLDKQHDISQSIGQTFMALGKVVSTELTTAFDNLTDDGVEFGQQVGKSVAELIRMGGDTYDIFETVGDIFSVVGASGQAAFYGVQEVAAKIAFNLIDTYESAGNAIIGAFEWVANKIQDGFEKTINYAIVGLNELISLANQVPGINISTIQEVKFKDVSFKRIDESAEKTRLLQERIIPATQGREDATKALSEAWADLWANETTGSDFADKIADSFEKSFAEIQKEAEENQGATPSSSPTVINFNDLIEDKTKENKLIEDNNELTNNEIKNIINQNEAIEDTTDTISDFLDTFYNDKDSVYETVSDTTDTISDFGKAVNNLDYGLDKVTDTLETFIFQFNDVLFNSLQSNSSALAQIGASTAFNTISYSQALYEANIAKEELIANPLSATIGEAYTTAYNNFVSSASDYLDPSNFGSMEEFRFAQSTVGTQASQLQGVASAGASVLDSMNSFLGEINQALADGVLTDEESLKLRTISSDVNAKNDILLGNSGVKGATNTVADYIATLRGGKTSGIAISDIYSSVPSLQVATGLESPISSLNSSTQAVAGNTSSISSKTDTSNANLASIDSKVGKIRSTTTTQLNIYRNKYTGTEWIGSSSPTSDYAYVGPAGSKTTYSYYSKGGFTGFGMGQRDHTGEKQAGIVHEGEWVAPKWMVNSNKGLFNSLESARQNKGFSQGGYTTPSFNVNATIGDNGAMNEMQKDIKELKNILANVTENGNLMNIRVAG